MNEVLTTAWVFPGQGSQEVGMGKNLLHHPNPDLARIALWTYQEASDELCTDISALCLYGPQEKLNASYNTQPALLTTSIAALRMLEIQGIRPDVVLGHSAGQYAALVAARSLSFREALKLTYTRGNLMLDAGKKHQGGMLAVLGLTETALEYIATELALDVASYNAPGQMVLSGSLSLLDQAKERIQKARGKAKPLNIPFAAHSRLMESTKQQMALILANAATIHNPSLPILLNSSVTFAKTGMNVRIELVEQMTSPVQWRQSIQLLSDSGTTSYLEVGHGTVLTGLIHRIDPKAQIQNTDTLWR